MLLMLLPIYIVGLPMLAFVVFGWTLILLVEFFSRPPASGRGFLAGLVAMTGFAAGFVWWGTGVRAGTQSPGRFPASWANYTGAASIALVLAALASCVVTVLLIIRWPRKPRP